jgi:glutathionyl-hydroquinone reductase
MVKGKWITDWNPQDPSGKFNEPPTTFRDRVTAD